MYEIQIHPIKMLYIIAADADLQDCAAILSSSYDIRKDKLGSMGQVLALNFDDITAAEHSKAFDYRLARQICDFVRELPDSLDTLFICCDSGQSRSSAIAAAIMRYKGLNEMKIWTDARYHPNLLVYEKLCSAFALPCDAADISCKAEISRRAFSKAVRG